MESLLRGNKYMIKAAWKSRKHFSFLYHEISVTHTEEQAIAWAEWASETAPFQGCLDKLGGSENAAETGNATRV